MRIAQITDLHVSDDPYGVRRFVDANERLARAVDAIGGLAPRPDVVLLTGDLVDDGTPEQYALLRGLLAPLEVPMLPVPGNHDLHGPFRDCFADVLPDGVAGDHCSYVVEPRVTGAPRLVGFDSSHPERVDGVAPPDRLAWLDEHLADAPDVPTLLFLHHPPLESTIWWMDLVGMAVDDAAALRRVIEDHPQVRLVACGHIHRPIDTVVGAARVSICPSTTHQAGLAIDEETGPTMEDQRGGFQLHLWTGERFVTHTERIDDRVDSVRLDTLAGDLDRYRALRSAGAITKADLTPR